MPTGYTYCVKDGVTFEQFAMRCVRAMGACIAMRDDPTDAPIPDRFEPSKHNAEFAASARAELAVLLEPMFDVDVAAREQYDAAVASYDKRKAERDALRTRYQDLILRTESWNVPTPEHAGLRDFMLSQLRESLDWDCDDRYDIAPIPIDGPTWLSNKTDSLKSSIAYHDAEQIKENERVEKRNTYLAQLRASLA